MNEKLALALMMLLSLASFSIVSSSSSDAFDAGGLPDVKPGPASFSSAFPPADMNAVLQVNPNSNVAGLPKSAGVPSLVAIFQDENPSGLNSTQQVLAANGIPYTIFGSPQIGSVDISGFDKVIISSTQPFSFYAAVEANRGWFESYVNGGGTLEIHGADYPWSHWPTGVLPCGFTYQNVELGEGYNVDVALPGNDILTTPNFITDAELDGWDSSYHGYFTSCPANSQIVLTEGDSGSAYPVLVVAHYGNGLVIASGQPLEWGYHCGYSNLLENVILARPTVAIFQDWDPWGLNSTQQVLAANGITYTIFGSPRIGSMDISGFDKVIISSVQPASFYAAVEANRGWFESYVNGGGILEIHGADYGDGMGWPTGVLPCGFTYQFAPGNTVDIALPGHDILTTANVITDAELDGWDSSYHGYFTSCPANAQIVLTEGDSGSAYPVLVVAPYGSGFVIASGQTLEWGYSHGYSNLLENLISYKCTPDWTKLGGYVISNPSMIVDDQGRTHIFVVGGDDALWDNVNGAWHCLGGVLASAPFPVKDNHGLIHVLVRGGDSALWDLRFDTGALTASWYGLGGCIADMPTANEYGGTLIIMVRGCDNALWCFDLTDLTGMTGYWVGLGGSFQGCPFVMEGEPGTFHTFVRGSDNALWDLFIDYPEYFCWYGLGGSLGEMVLPTAVLEPGHSGNVAAMVRGSDGGLWMCNLHLYSMTYEWVSLGGSIMSGGYAITDTAGNIHTFVKGADNAAWENVFSSTSWSPGSATWCNLGGVMHSSPWPPVAYANGLTHMAVIGSDSALWKKVYTTIAPSAGAPSEAEGRIRKAEPSDPRGPKLTEAVSGTTVGLEIPAEIVPVEDKVAIRVMSEHAVPPSAVEGGM